MGADILGYGIYIPSYRIRLEEIAAVWEKEAGTVEKSLGGLKEKSVAGQDEDTVTLAFEAASLALQQAGLSPETLESCLIGSESHPYAVNPTATIVAEFLGVGRNYFASDLEFACKGGSTGLILTASLIAAGVVKAGLVIGADTAQAKPHDILEYTAASAAAAYILGKEENERVAEIFAATSFSSDTPDFWRRDGVRFPSHGGRFTGEPAYFHHILQAARQLLAKTQLSPSDFHYCVFHMPNSRFPREVAKRLGFTEEKLRPSLVVDYLGNPYSASSLLGLAAVLDIAKEGEKIFFVSYGSGAGSDALAIETKKALKEKRKKSPSFFHYLKKKTYLSYTQYLKFQRKI